MTSFFTSQVESSKGSNYRPEIDGLRAFAVVCVIINHFNKEFFPGGYLGVDIFFVISGFVITSSLYQRPYQNLRDFIIGFYERRVKRILPALSIFVFISSIIICLFNPEPRISLKTGAYSLFGLSNIYLNIRATDYFGESSALNIFTHTWSLGIEEQFYLFFPFLVWFSGFGRETKNGARNLLLTIGILTVASLIGFLYFYQVRQPTAYFFMPLRFWEMATGCLVFVGLKKIKSSNYIFEKLPTFAVLLVIIVVMCIPNSWASVATFSVVLLTALLLISFKNHTLAFKIFSNPKIVYIGLISYSLYLWHWAVIVISRWTVGIHWWSIPFQVLIIIVLAMTSYTWIEQPFRKRKWFGKRFKTLLISGGFLITLSSGIVLLYKPPLKGKLFTGNINSQKTPLTYDGRSLRTRCLTVTKSVEEIFKDCMYKRKGNKETIWLMGDSHAEAILFGVSSLARELKMNLFTYFYVLTAFPSTPYKVINNENIFAASKINSKIEDEMYNKFKLGDIVIIHMRHALHFKGDSDKWLFLSDNGSFVKKSDKSFYLNQWKTNVENFAKKAESKGVNIILLTPNAEFANTNRCIGKNDQWFNSLSKVNCAGSKNEYNKNYQDINNVINKLSKTNKNIFVINSLNAMCSEEMCYFAEDKKGLYYDEDHISNYGSMEKIFPALMDLIKKHKI